MIFLKFISFKTLRSLLTDFIIFLIPLGLILFLFPYILRLFLPFIVGFLLYMAANPLNKRLQKRNLPRGICASLSLIIICTAVFFILKIVFSKLLTELSALSSNADAIYDTFSRVASKISSFSQKKNLPDVIKTNLGRISDVFSETFKNALMQIFSNISSRVVQFIKNIPSFLVSVFAAAFTTFFILKEDERVFAFFRKFLGEKTCSFFSKIKDSFFSVTFSYLKAQLIIESFVFVVLVAGFFILKVEYSFILAFFTALVDVVPVFGTGTVLIPMSVFNFLSGDFTLGWGLLILYGIAQLTRQLCEPKIIGDKLGIHPLATVFSIYTGMQFFGVFGLIFGPIIAIFIKNIITAEKNQKFLQ
ncbi:MAG: sporulation integral membrane protein YtvI [Clostridia bacterium]|nr:sporulation integral membrane protein YtvI [Clostridia bacterium]